MSSLPASALRAIPPRVRLRSLRAASPQVRETGWGEASCSLSHDRAARVWDEGFCFSRALTRRFRRPLPPGSGRWTTPTSHDQVALRDARAPLQLDLADDAGRRRRHVHRRLLGLERDQRRIGLDRVARLDHDVDDLDVRVVADVRHAHFDERIRGHVAVLRAQTVTGFGFSGSMPNDSIALRTVPRSSLPSSASALSAATTT